MPGSRRSPDMLTPAMMPVTAGKKIANTVQKPVVGSAPAQISTSVFSMGLPKISEIRETAMAAMMKYWARIAARADTMARTATATVVIKAVTFRSSVGKTPVRLSAKPMV